MRTGPSIVPDGGAHIARGGSAPPPRPAQKVLIGRRLVVVSVVFFLLHAGFGEAARWFEVAPGVSLWYPPAGLALALVIMAGWRAAPVVFAANLFAALVSSRVPFSLAQLALPVLLSAIYVAGGIAVHRWFGALPSVGRPGRAAALIFLLLAAPAAAALGGAGLAVVTGFTAAAQFPATAFNWWTGDVLGVLTITPLCLVHIAPKLLQVERPARPRRSTRAWLELTGQIVAVAGCLVAVRAFGFVHARQSFYLCFIPLVWICLRHGLRGATVAVAALTMGSLMAVHLAGASGASLADLLLFEIAVSSIGLGLGATVSRRDRAENERSRLLAILEATPDYIATADLSGRVLYQNTALLRLHGRPAAEAGRPFAEFLPDWAAQRLVAEAVPTALQRGLWEGETALLDAAGREVPVWHRVIAHAGADGLPAMLSAVARDLSAEKRAEQTRIESERNLVQAQKLESLGVLAGGIAHDFNNLLTVMLGHATLARLDLAAESPAERAVHQIELAALRAAELCRQMLAYSGKGRLATELLDLTRLVEQTTHLLEVSVSKKCRLQFELARNLPPVRADATQLSQITMNLVINASDACNPQGGEITVGTGRMHVDRAYLAGTYLAPDLPAGDYVFLEVRDNGTGMSPEVLARVFEPFFSTKFSGHGLGLSAVLGIARSHRGAVKVVSAPGRGTTFRLLLPAVAGTVAAAPTPAAGAGSWRGQGCILVVDDEEAVRTIAAQILEHHGFTAAVAADGRQGVDQVVANPSGFVAVLLDLSMPVMNGAEAFSQIRQINPRLPVILMSGYNRTDSAVRFPGEEPAGFLQKPFDAARLAELVRGVLERPPAGMLAAGPAA